MRASSSSKTRWTSGLLATALVAFSLFPGVSQAFEWPTIERGIKPDRAFQVGDVDNINLLNGNLVIAIPIGQRYPVGGALSYGFTLYYNANLWRYEVNNVPQPPYPGPFTRAYPNHGSNAGFGWRLSLGELYTPTAAPPYPCLTCYVGPDGATHQFVSQLHPDVSAPANTWYTRDGTFLRLRSVANSEWEIDFPSGEIHHFDSAGRLRKIFDYFENAQDQPVNWVLIDYGTNTWTISDSVGRSHTVSFTSGPNLGPIVSSISLASFGGVQASTTFAYATTDVPRSCLDDDATTSPRISLPLLTSVSLPDGVSSWRMPEYKLPAPHLCSAGNFALAEEGLIGSLELPTLGIINWEYGVFRFPSPIEEINLYDGAGPPWLREVTGVTTRTVYDPIGNVTGQWTYQQDPGIYQQSEESWTRVTTPLAD